MVISAALGIFGFWLIFSPSLGTVDGVGKGQGGATGNFAPAAEFVFSLAAGLMPGKAAGTVHQLIPGGEGLADLSDEGFAVFFFQVNAAVVFLHKTAAGGVEDLFEDVTLFEEQLSAARLMPILAAPQNGQFLLEKLGRLTDAEGAVGEPFFQGCV